PGGDITSLSCTVGRKPSCRKSKDSAHGRVFATEEFEGPAGQALPGQGCEEAAYVPRLPLVAGRWTEPAHRYLRSRSGRLRSDGSGRAAEDQERDRSHVDP